MACNATVNKVLAAKMLNEAAHCRGGTPPNDLTRASLLRDGVVGRPLWNRNHLESLVSHQPEHRVYGAILVLRGLLRACLAPPYARRLLDEGTRARSVVALDGFRPIAGDELELASSLELPRQDLDEFHAMVEGSIARLDHLDTLLCERGGQTHSSPRRLFTSTSARHRSPWSRLRQAHLSRGEQTLATPTGTGSRRSRPCRAAQECSRLTTAIYVPYQGCVAIEAPWCIAWLDRGDDRRGKRQPPLWPESTTPRMV